MKLPSLTVPTEWDTIFQPGTKAKLENILPDFLRSCRWFGGKARRIKAVEIEEAIQVRYGSATAYVTFVRVDYAEGAPDTYALPLMFVAGEAARKIESENPYDITARLTARGQDGILCAALRDADFCKALLETIGKQKSFKGASGEIRGAPTLVYQQLAGQNTSGLVPVLMGAEQSNSSIRFNDRLILKLFRRLDRGVNPDLEMGAFLTEKGFPNIPPVGGALEYDGRRGEPITLGILRGYVPNKGDAWQYTLGEISQFYQRVIAQGRVIQPEWIPETSVRRLVEREPHPEAQKLVGAYLHAIRLLGKRTAELHLALASDNKNDNFAPEPFSPSYQRTVYESMQSLVVETFKMLDEREESLPKDLRDQVRRTLEMKAAALEKFHPLLVKKIAAMRTRVHGDYHLGQVLYTGNDFVIIDFEGEPARPIEARRIKRSPLCDVAGMLRSFHYAAYGELVARAAADEKRQMESAALEPWAQLWYGTISGAFLRSYLEAAGRASFLPQDKEELALLLGVYSLEKAIYEVAYELNNRPAWLGIPLRGILQFLEVY